MKSRQRPTAEQKRGVRERASGICEYCRSQEDFATESSSIEHVIPASQSGETVPENLALACQGCNNHKYAKTSAPDPVDGKHVPLYHPRRQHWEEHFRWSENFQEIIGLTPTGRATVIAIQMNRHNLINLRRVLYVLGEHPPK
ncbi:MAG: HNH endonuclease [Chloroflexi bacterium]|nr:HNH endonuclease [Chloroflexota bacterium]